MLYATAILKLHRSEAAATTSITEFEKCIFVEQREIKELTGEHTETEKLSGSVTKVADKN